MGHNFVVAHCRKVQTGVGLRNVADHNCRTAVYDRDLRPLDPQLPEFISHPERAAMNEGERCGGLAVLKRRSDRIAAAQLARKPQRNAASAIEIVISGSPEWFSQTKPDRWKAYFKDARAFLEQRYGKENVLHWAVHYDEKTPHMHMLLAPIVQTEKGAKYTSSEFLGNRKGLADLQERIWQDVGKKYGLERGVDGSRARHTDQFTWASEIAQERDNLHQERGSLDMVARDLKERERALEGRERALAERERDFEALSRVEIPPVELDIPSKPSFAAMRVFTASDGTKDLQWPDFVAREAALEAKRYAERVMRIARSKEAAVLKSVRDAGKLPAVMAKLQEAQDLVAGFRRLSPAQLRELADQKEKQRNIKRESGLGDVER